VKVITFIMAHVDFQDVSVSFSYPLGQIDKPTAAKLIADISKFRLNESVVVDLTVDEQGHGVAVIRCPSRAVANNFVEAVNQSQSQSHAKATLKPSAAAKEKDDARRRSSSSRSEWKRSNSATGSSRQLPQQRRRQSGPDVTCSNRRSGRSDSGDSRRFRVHLLFESEMNKADVVEIVRQRSKFRLNVNVIELDVVDTAAAAAYGAFVMCQDRNMAAKLVDSLNRTSASESTFASLIDSTSDDFSSENLLHKLNARAKKS
jgi:uncharacterized protein YlxP (DUF503 family)